MITSSAGGQVESGNVNISKWSLNEIPLVVLSQSNSTELTGTDWKVSAFPNPVAENLNLQIETGKEKEFLIELRDLLGKKVLGFSEMVMPTSQVLSVDFKNLPPSTYLFSVSSKGGLKAKVIKVQKQNKSQK